MQLQKDKYMNITGISPALQKWINQYTYTLANK